VQYCTVHVGECHIEAIFLFSPILLRFERTFENPNDTHMSQWQPRLQRYHPSDITPALFDLNNELCVSMPLGDADVGVRVLLICCPANTGPRAVLLMPLSLPTAAIFV
jgi:hypothetical protein